MARAQSTDFLQNFRFHVRTLATGGTPTNWTPIDFNRPDSGGTTGIPSATGSAGFQSVSIPDTSIDAVEYREGTYKYTKKFAGVPTIGDVSLMRGVVPTDTVFYDWMIRAVAGGEYRADIEIMQFARGNMANTTNPGENTAVPSEGARSYKCYECLPTRAKAAGDLDATSSEVAMAECDFALEYYTVTVGPTTPTPAT
jgi:phage tail-like protein